MLAYLCKVSSTHTIGNVHAEQYCKLKHMEERVTVRHLVQVTHSTDFAPATHQVEAVSY